MYELLVSCFDIDGRVDHERSVFKRPPGNFKVSCTKNPREAHIIESVLSANPDLYVIYVVRDPRDVVVSEHKTKPGEYYVELAQWLFYEDKVTSLKDHSRFIRVSYESLAADPSGVQKQLQTFLPFVALKHQFSDFHKVAKPSADAVNALHEVRPINSASIGGWRNHLPRIKVQLLKYGDISQALIANGYEASSAWLDDIVTADEKRRLPDRDQVYDMLEQQMAYDPVRLARKIRYYRLERMPVIGNLVKRLHDMNRRRKGTAV